MRSLVKKQELVRFFKFALVGVTGTIVDFGIMNLVNLAFGVPLLWAQGISFIIAVINNFLWNRYWTYPDSRSKKAPKQLLQFFMISSVGLIIRTPLISWLNRIILDLLETTTLQLPLENFVVSQNLALAASILIILFWNFFANRLWTYNDVSVPGPYPDPTQSQTTIERK